MKALMIAAVMFDAIGCAVLLPLATRAVWRHKVHPYLRARRPRLVAVGRAAVAPQQLLDEQLLADILTRGRIDRNFPSTPWLHTAAVATGALDTDVSSTGFTRATAEYIRALTNEPGRHRESAGGQR